MVNQHTPSYANEELDHCAVTKVSTRNSAATVITTAAQVPCTATPARLRRTAASHPPHASCSHPRSQTPFHLQSKNTNTVVLLHRAPAQPSTPSGRWPYNVKSRTLGVARAEQPQPNAPHAASPSSSAHVLIMGTGQAAHKTPAKRHTREQAEGHETHITRSSCCIHYKRAGFAHPAVQGHLAPGSP